VAIKLLPPETISDESARKRLVREARAAATLDHPNICSIYEVGEADGRSFIAMQYVEGETLDLKLKRKPLELRESLTIASQIADLENVLRENDSAQDVQNCVQWIRMATCWTS